MQPVTETGPPRLGIIIVTHQCARYMAPLWRSLAATVDSRRTSICVFDNASTDETVAILKRENDTLGLSLQVICSKDNFGFARANNEAFDCLQAQGDHDIIVLLNPDTVVQAGWWEPLVKMLEDPTIGMAVPLLLLPDGKINSRGNALHFLGLGYVQGLGEEVSEEKLGEPFFSGSGAAIALDMRALAEMNILFGPSRIFWDELFIYGEDSDLGWRIRLAGFHPKLCPESRIVHDYHYPAIKPLEVEDRLFLIERNRYLLLLINFKIATLFILLPWIIASELALVCRVWKLYPRRLRLWRGIWGKMGSPTFRPRRRGLQAGRKIKDRDILQAMTGSIRHGARPFSTMDKLMDGALRGSHRFLCWLIWW